MNASVSKSFTLSTSGFFDFDLTFFLELFFFLLLAYAVTFFFINPISSQLNARSILLDEYFKKTCILIRFGSATLSTSFSFFLEEIQEMLRQAESSKKLLDVMLDHEIITIKEKNLNILNKSEKVLFSKSAHFFELEVANLYTSAKVVVIPPFLKNDETS